MWAGRIRSEYPSNSAGDAREIDACDHGFDAIEVLIRAGCRAGAGAAILAFIGAWPRCMRGLVAGSMGVEPEAFCCACATPFINHFIVGLIRRR